MLARRKAVYSILMVAGLALAACAQSDTTTTTQPVPTISTTAAAQATDQFGFVQSLTDGTLVFDPAQLLTGDEALTAARQAGIIGADEDLPNDFFILNPDQTDERELTVVDDAEFVMVGFDASGGLTDSPVSAAEFEAVLSGSVDTSGFYGIVPGDLPMTLVLNGDTVIGGTQTYLP